MKSVFLIKTPLQLLNAIEAKHYFKLSKDDCIVIIMADRKSQPQIQALTESIDEWCDVVSLNEINLFFGSPFLKNITSIFGKLQQSKYFKRSFFYVPRLNKISRYLGDVEYIVVGYTNYVYMNHFINVTPHRELVFLDDGNGTLDLSEKRKNGFNKNSNIKLSKKIKLYGKRLIQGIKEQEEDKACFFTAYDISVRSTDRVVKNEFNYLRSNVDSLPTIDEAYFIGSPLSEITIITQDEYLTQLSKVKKYFGQKPLIYIAHRRDSAEKLDLIKNKLGIKVVLFDYPIEYQLAFIGPRPIVLASFYSAALDSCRLIFGDELKIISFRLNMENSIIREKVESIYASYEATINDNFIVESDY
ncbi:MAG: hypothetical protein DIZ80_15780 [endosymbiont of Galathealinum brachiosum]|uniref:Uncharacterized protein n=1 Tax=endosymbiont of Galathealinum brachiosum TaxID=2200906 RepID=A0A370DBH8_9GAMM|nr:MAG: hypothetical protein DIZ80_15780 [endosymbiont of Galathealinum brachiosum]